ncbi:tail fiber domain-containing protein [Micromonospora aurantiaca (nom. illeg.)]|uniref:tail fiber domain-containing protein n=1 Tax=Micromonospora aurantiaca (nom. illeg.) TaxID=47850 RepID=UPI0011A28F94|nr:tail fiber domain-containing protein [Micromonospora aurantiaca]MBC9000512.1 tail fiber domain-containing protein [Micromonospora aurantiaca]
MTTAADQAITQLAKRLSETEARLAALERGSQLGHSSIEAGQLTVSDAEGNPVLVIGDQGDGTYAVAGVNGGVVVAQDLNLPAGTITETDISDDAISTPKLTANAVTADKIEAGSVTSDKIAANAVTAGKIEAGSISTDKLTVGSQGAIAARVVDACGDLADWAAAGVAGTLTVQQVVDSVTGGTVFRAGGAVTGLVRTPVIPFDPTALYRIKIRVRQTVAPTGDTTASKVSAGFAAVMADGATYVDVTGTATPGPTNAHYVAAANAVLVAGAGWQEFTGYLRGTATTGTSTARPDPNNPGAAVTGTRYLRPVLNLNAVAGNGTAEVDLVAVDVIPAGAISAVSIADGAITADKLSANAITGKVITGGTFFTRSAAPRVEMGETAYEGGAVASIKWDLLGRGWDEPVIQANQIGTGSNRRFTIRGPAGTLGAAGTSMVAEDTDFAWQISCWTDPITAISVYRFTPSGGLELSLPHSAASKAITFNEGYSIYVDNAGAGGSNNRWWLDTPGNGEVILGPRAGSAFIGSLRLRTNATTTSAANCFIDSGTHKISRSTSSIRYKTDVEDLELSLDALRSLRPVRFRDRGEVEERGDDARWYAGFVAEEVDQLGLGELVTYLHGEPDGVQYDRFTAALMLLVRDQDRQLAKLAERVVELERRAAG